MKRIVTAALVVAVVVAVPLLIKARNAGRQPSEAAAPTSVAGQPCVAVDGQPGSCGPEASVAKPTPRFVDLGTTSCAPCKVMLGVMQELEGRVGTALKIEFINVKDQPDAMEQYGTRTIPTQVFFSPEGKELFRHSGVMRADAVVAKWAELGFDLGLKGAK